jgi:hypothetical protein
MDQLHEFSRFHILLVGSMKMTVFWDVALCSLEEIYQYFWGTFCLQHQGLVIEAVSTSEMPVIF